MIKKIFCSLLAFIFALQMVSLVYADGAIKTEAESYSDYYDTTDGNVMVGGVGTDDVETAVGATGVVVSVDATEWLEYEVDIPREGLYSLTINGAVREQATMPLVKISAQGKSSLEYTLPTTGGRNKYDNIKIGNIILESGVNTIKILTEQKGFMFDYFEIEYVGEAMRMLQNENCIEAESADVIPENLLDESTGTVAVLGNGEEVTYTLGGYFDDVYFLSALVKGKGSLCVMVGGEVVAQNDIDEEDYAIVSFDNIMLFEGRNILTLKASGSLNLDYFNLLKFDPSVEEETEEIILEAENADRKEGNMSDGVTGAVKFISFNQGRAFEFDINLPYTGLYQISVNSALDAKYYEKQNLELTIGGEKKKATTYPTKSYYEWELFPLCGIFLEAGEHTLRVEATYGGTHIDNFVVKYLGDEILLRGLSVNYKAVVKNSYIPKGTDEIIAYYNMELDASGENGYAEVLCDGKEIPVKSVVDGKSVRIQLLKALSDASEIEVSLNGFCDVTKALTAESDIYTLYTGAEDEGFSEFKNVTATISYEDIKVFGTVLSGTGNTIEGRAVEMYVKSPDGTISDGAVCTTVTSADGSFELEYTLPPKSEAGVYKLILYCEYAPEPYILTVIYLDKELEKVLLGSIKESETAEDIKAIFAEYADTLGLDVENDLSSLSDENAFYKHFAKKEIKDKDELFTYYDKYLLLEKINQTNDKTLVDFLMTNEENCELLGLSVDRINLLGENNTIAMNEIFELDAIDDLDEFEDVINKIIEKNIAKQLNVKEANLVTEEITAETGAAASFDFITDTGFIEIQEATFTVTSSDISLKDADVKALCDGKAVAEKTENKLVVTLVPEWSLSEITEFAKISFVVPDEAGDYAMAVSGVLKMTKKYAVSETENETTVVYVHLDEKIVDVSVEARRSSGSSGSSGASPGKSYESSGGGAGGGMQNNVPVIPQIPENEDENIFTDVAKNHWAYESVNGLAEKNIISKAQNFEPDRNITREEFAKMLVNVLGIYDANAKTDFKDVADGSWYAPYIASAKAYNIINGVDEENFGVGKEITRQDMAVMIFRALKLQPAENTVNFADHEEIADYAKDAIYKMQEKGIINGIGDNMFAPKTPANRAMAAKIIFGMLEMTEGTK